MSRRPIKMRGGDPLAVALEYEAPGTPRVIASGRGEIGKKIIEVARAHGVPVEENAGLAEALSEVEIGNEIPVELYRAVAEVLTFILRASGRLPARTTPAASRPQPGARRPSQFVSPPPAAAPKADRVGGQGGARPVR
jgi:flagellar biosynthesis protein